MIVFMEDAAQAITSTDVEGHDFARIGDRLGWREERPGVRDVD
jgi:hypothetical protein